jgi:hypothetical protein
VTFAGEFVALLTNDTDPLALPLAVGAKEIVAACVPPADNVKGRTRPLTLYALPVTLAAEIVTLPVPVFDSVTLWFAVAPIATVPYAIEVGDTLRSCVWAVPLPVKDTVAGEFEALLTKDNDPLAVPVACGEKVTLKVALLPTAIVAGNDGPLTLYPVPVTFAADTVTDTSPVFDTTADFVDVEPVATLPKLMLVGDTLAVFTVPVPDNGTLRAPLEALVWNAMLPFAAPRAVGAKVTVKV